MTSIKLENKRTIKSFNEKIKKASVDNIGDILEEYYHEDTIWNGPHPLNTLNGREALVNKFWKPFLKAFPDVQKDDYMLFAGNYNDADWVMTTGNFVGTFENDYLEIPATKGAVWIRYGEFHKIVDGKVKETYIIFDLLDLMRQAGFKFVKSLASEIIIPGPATFDGIIMNESDEAESQKSLKLVEDMIYIGLGQNKDFEKRKKDKILERYWSNDFMWYGPCGIGSTRGIKGFNDYHSGPFLEAVPNYSGGNHVARFAEGNYVASTGWPSIIAEKAGPWLGLPATGKPVTMRVMDMWRREGDLLVENWVFIDIIEYLLQIGVDVFDRLRNRKHII